MCAQGRLIRWSEAEDAVQQRDARLRQVRQKLSRYHHRAAAVTASPQIEDACAAKTLTALPPSDSYPGGRCNTNGRSQRC